MPSHTPRPRKAQPDAPALPLAPGTTFEPAPEVREHAEGGAQRPRSKVSMEKLWHRLRKAQVHFSGPAYQGERRRFPVKIYYRPAGEHRMVLETGIDAKGRLYVEVEGVGRVRRAADIGLPHHLYRGI